MVPPNSSPRPGDTVAGRYRIDAELGRGGHGVVYRATQQPLGHQVALKMLLPEAILAEGSIERFMREAALAQRLTHPNTVRLFDFGQTEHGLPFIVWELLRGCTLDQEIARGPFTAQRTARVAEQVLKSLMEAHACGIVHRDIKPQNVFLGDHPGETDFVKVLDFGVATTLPGAAQGPPVTRDGQLIGTPNYMAPEQVCGGVLSPRTDLYALGLVMAEALAGFCVVNDTSPIKVWMLQASPTPVALPQVVSHSVLGAVITRATRKAPEERYGSADEMLADLERALAASTAATDPFQKPLRPTMPLTAHPPPTPNPQYQTVPHRTPHPGQMTPLVGPYSPAMGMPSAAPVGYSASGRHDTTLRSVGQQSSPQPSAQSGGYNSAPAVQAPTPMPMMSATPQSSTMSGLLVATLIGAMLAIFGLLGLVAFLFLRSPDGGGGGGPIGGGGRVGGNGGSSVSVPAGALAKVTKERTLTRIKSAGWGVMSADENHAVPGYSITTISVTRPPTGGTVQIYDYEGMSTAAATEDALMKTANSVVARDGGKIVFVAVFGDRAAALELLNSIIR